MIKSLYHKDFTDQDLEAGFQSMIEELEFHGTPTWVNNLFWLAWDDFVKNKWSYDGATFSKERFDDTIFEVAALIHDWLNSNGIVSYQADGLMLKVMKHLEYSRKERFLRYLKTRFTFLNILRHKYILKTYKGKYPLELVLLR